RHENQPYRLSQSSAALPQGDNRIGANFAPRFLETVRPIDPHLYAGTRAEPEVHVNVAGAQVASIRVRMAPQRFIAGHNRRDPPPYPTPIAFDAPKATLEPMAARRPIQQQACRSVVVRHHYVDVPVVIDVAKGRSAPDFGKLKSRSSLRARIAKLRALIVQ